MEGSQNSQEDRKDKVKKIANVKKVLAFMTPATVRKNSDEFDIKKKSKKNLARLLSN